jgi:polysaccharide biosynthesis protein VpsQ
MKSQRVWQFVLVIYVIILGVISGLAYTKRLHVAAIVGKSHADKLIHFVLLGGASFLARRATADARMRLGNLPLGPFVVGALATIDEFAQALSPVRTFSLGDLAANLSGVVVFGWLAGSRRSGTLEADRSTTKDSS